MDTKEFIKQALDIIKEQEIKEDFCILDNKEDVYSTLKELFETKKITERTYKITLEMLNIYIDNQMKNIG